MNVHVVSIVYGLLGAAGVIALACAVTNSELLPHRARGSARVRILLQQARARNGVRLVAAGVLGASVGWATGWPVAGGAVAAGVLVVPRLLRPARPARGIALCEALAAWSRRLGDVLAAGAGGLPQALARTASTAPEPISEPVQQLARRVRTDGLEPALRGFADELADPAADELVLALLLRQRAGGRGLVEILHAQAGARAAEATARRDVEADRAGPRTTVRSLLAITVLLVAGLVVFAGDYLAPYGTAAGQGVLLLVIGVMSAALWWMHHLTTASAGQRYLTAGHGGEA